MIDDINEISLIFISRVNLYVPMKTLTENWFIEGRIDLELKQYVFLDYLQSVKKDFDENKLYPTLPDLLFQLKDLEKFQSDFIKLSNNFPKALLGIDFQNSKLVYPDSALKNEYLEIIDQIINFSVPKLKTYIKKGEELLKYIQKDIDIKPIGIIPLYKKEGYLLLTIEGNKIIFSYKYKILDVFKFDFESKIQTTFIKKFKKLNRNNNYETIKEKLTKEYVGIPNIATYLVETEKDYPIEETVIPLAKDKLMKILNYC